LIEELDIMKEYTDFISNNNYNISIKKTNKLLKSLQHFIKNKNKIIKKFYKDVDNELKDKKIKITKKYSFINITEYYSFGTRVENKDIETFFKNKIIYDIPRNIHPVFTKSLVKSKNLFSTSFIKSKNYFHLFALKYEMGNFKKHFVVLDKSIIQYAIYMRDNFIPHMDYSKHYKYLELKTLKYKNKTTTQITDELIKNERTFLEIINSFKCFNNIQELGKIILPVYGNYKNIFTIEKPKSIYDICKTQQIEKRELYDYSGSYHIWFTIPYKKNTSPDMFIKNHVVLASFLQLLEPLFISTYFSPDYNVVGNPHKYTSGSYRHIINSFGGYGTTDIKLLFGTTTHANGINYYNSLESFINNDTRSSYLRKKVKIYHKNGNLIINYSSDEGRYGTNKTFGLDIGTYNYRNKISNVKTYIEQIQDKIKIHSRDGWWSKLGADIRTKDWGENIEPPLKKGWSYTHIVEDKKLYRIYFQSKKIKPIRQMYNYEEYIINTKPYNIQYTPPYDYKAFEKILKSKRVGIEYRIFDNIDSKYMNDILRILSLIVTHSLYVKDITYFNTKQYWHDATTHSILDGYNASPPLEYIKTLEKSFDIKLPRKCNMCDLYKNLVSGIYKKYKNNAYYKLLTGDNTHIPKIVNINKEVWDMFFYNKLISCKELQNNFNTLKNIYFQNTSIKIKDFTEYVVQILGENWKLDSEKILFYIIK